MKNKIRNIITPVTNNFKLNPAGETIGPRISMATTNLEMSNNVFAIFSLCRFVSFIIDIIQQIKTFVNHALSKLSFFYCLQKGLGKDLFRKSGVKQKIRNMKLCRRIRIVPIIVWVRLAISRGLSVGFALFLVVVLLNSFLVVSVNAKDSEEKIDVSVEVRKLKSKDLNEKLDAMNKLKKVKKTDKRAKDALLKELKAEKNPYFKSRIIESLVDDQDKVTTREIIYTLQKDTSTDVRYAAAYAFAYSKDESVVPVLISVFLNENEDLGVRFQAADALTYYKPTEEIYQCFVKGLENRSVEV